MIKCLSCDNTEPIGSVFCTNCGKGLIDLLPPLAEGELPEEPLTADERTELLESSDWVREGGFSYRVLHSKPAILRVEDPQVHYILVELLATESVADVRPSVNMSLIIDRSTSMKGHRLEQVKHATISIIEALELRDNVSIISFSDRAQTVLSPDESRRVNLARSRLSMMHASGGTEIAQGLNTGLNELYSAFSIDGVNHIVLLTDGRTYGDEQECRALADEAAEKGVIINAIGIGHDWSDDFLDDLAKRTGGHVTFLDRPSAAKKLLQRVFESLEHIAVNNVRFDGAWETGVTLQSAYRLRPEPMPLGDELPLKLGPLPGDRRISTLLELEVEPFEDMTTRPLAKLSVVGDVIASDEIQQMELELLLPITDDLHKEAPPREISSALGALTLYRMQEKARQDAESGDIMKAVQLLETLATNLQAIDQKRLAYSALEEAKGLIRSMRLSQEGSKMLKYGTRTLLLMAGTGEE
jgi:Ca-activated chloride channel family protein